MDIMISLSSWFVHELALNTSSPAAEHHQRRAAPALTTPLTPRPRRRSTRVRTRCAFRPRRCAPLCGAAWAVWHLFCDFIPSRAHHQRMLLILPPAVPPHTTPCASAPRGGSHSSAMYMRWAAADSSWHLRHNFTRQARQELPSCHAGLVHRQL